ncbi:MAG: hypothetical protein ABIN25_11840 [Ginsengibacter sp.]
MRIINVFIKARAHAIIFIMAINLISARSMAQELKPGDFVLFGGTGGVNISSYCNIKGGSVGSFKLIKATNSSTFTSNLYSDGKIVLGDSNIVAGKIASGNSAGLRGINLLTGNIKISGNVDVKGNIVIGSGTVSGVVTHPQGTTYSGPLPTGGDIVGTPDLPTLPSLPAPINFPSPGATNIASSQVIGPGSYGNVTLRGKQTLTFSGAGIYTFRSIHNSGAINNFIFDFKNASTGTIKIYVHDDADLNKVGVSLVNGGSESRVYTEVHGTGGSSKSGAAFTIAKGSSSTTLKWLGAVYATAGDISIGDGSNGVVNDISGALISATKVTLKNGVSLKYAPFVDQVILPYYPPPANGKVYDLLGSELNSLYYNAGTYTDTARKLFILTNDSVYIECISLQGMTNQLLSLLLTPQYGLTDTISNGPNSLIITGKYPIANLLKLNLLTNLIDYCRPLFPAIGNGNSGITFSNGDIAIRSDFVRNGYNVSGDSIKVGVISDSYNNLFGNPAEIDLVNGDLPGKFNPYNDTVPVQVLKEYPFAGGSDEGRAMLQVIHDIAPKSTLAFRTGFISAGDFAQGIKELQQNNCNVIVDDVTYITEPFLQDGVVAQAVNQVTAQGVSYFSAAGNFGNTSYQGTFNPVPAPVGIIGTAHNFGGGDIYQSISLKPGTYTIVLQWDDNIYSMRQGGTKNDLDIYLTGFNGSKIFGFNRDNIGGDPIEVLPFIVTANTQANIMIIREKEISL